MSENGAILAAFPFIQFTVRLGKSAYKLVNDEKSFGISVNIMWRMCDEN